MNRNEIISSYRNHFSPSTALLFEIADCPVEYYGDGAWIFDENGNKYLDFCSGYGVFSIGYCNPLIGDVMEKQLKEMAFCPSFMRNAASGKLRTVLSDILPGDFHHFYFTASGSEAFEVALRTAQLAYPHRKGLISAINSYHGKTLGSLSIMGQPHLRKPFGTLMQDVQHTHYGDIAAIKSAISKNTLAVILEPILGGGYIKVPPAGYLAEVRSLCDKTGTLLIIDEVQTGFGRTGKMFGIEHDNIIPDIIVVSKGATGGFVPFSAVGISQAVREMLYSSNAAGYEELMVQNDLSNYPVICETAAAAIQYIKKEKLHERAELMGSYLIGKLKEVTARYPEFVIDIPGKALMTGVQLRNPMLESALWLQLLKRNVIGGLSTNYYTKHPVMRYFPPLIINKEQIDIAVGALDESLGELQKMPCLVYDLANKFLKLQYYLPKRILKLGVSLLRNPPRLKYHL